MKRVFSILLLVLLVIGIVGCGTQISSQDVQGFWYIEDAQMLMGFQGEEYIIYGFGTGVSITGVFEVEDQTITLHSDEYSDKIFKDVSIENDVLSFETMNGNIQRWKRISEEDVRSMLR